MLQGQHTFSQALDAAANTAGFTYKGVKGYVAVISSQWENNFVLSKFGESTSSRPGMWISAFDSNGEGEHWYWQTGPEKGQLVEYFAWGPSGPSSGLSCVNINYKKLPTSTSAFWDSDPCESTDPAALNDVLVEFECPAGYGFSDTGCEGKFYTIDLKYCDVM